MEQKSKITYEVLSGGTDRTKGKICLMRKNWEVLRRGDPETHYLQLDGTWGEFCMDHDTNTGWFDDESHLMKVLGTSSIHLSDELREAVLGKGV